MVNLFYDAFYDPSYENPIGCYPNRTIDPEQSVIRIIGNDGIFIRTPLTNSSYIQWEGRSALVTWTFQKPIDLSAIKAFYFNAKITGTEILIILEINDVRVARVKDHASLQFPTVSKYHFDLDGRNLTNVSKISLTITSIALKILLYGVACEYDTHIVPFYDNFTLYQTVRSTGPYGVPDRTEYRTVRSTGIISADLISDGSFSLDNRINIVRKLGAHGNFGNLTIFGVFDRPVTTQGASLTGEVGAIIYETFFPDYPRNIYYFQMPYYVNNISGVPSKLSFGTDIEFHHTIPSIFPLVTTTIRTTGERVLSNLIDMVANRNFGILIGSLNSGGSLEITLFYAAALVKGPNP